LGRGAIDAGAPVALKLFNVAAEFPQIAEIGDPAERPACGGNAEDRRIGRGL
jgi:hypothetical protein